MYDCKAPLSRFYNPETRSIINAFIIIIIIYKFQFVVYFKSAVKFFMVTVKNFWG